MKNEVNVAARAMKVGSKFWLSDIKQNGGDELKEMLKAKAKHESKGMKLAVRTEKQLKALGREL